jgi:hypothetical protein
MLPILLQAMAGIDKFLSPAELQAIGQHYTVPKTASMEVMLYTQFLADVDAIFTKKVSARGCFSCLCIKLMADTAACTG